MNAFRSWASTTPLTAARNSRNQCICNAHIPHRLRIFAYFVGCVQYFLKKINCREENKDSEYIFKGKE